ncbi:MAG: hypothetical protein DWI09_01515 [Planctomycetota bacterium]|jgi:hypothetical protein|nr:MAG: hypothetical protein DWI09_01515 [Planctomycetota bacterium]
MRMHVLAITGITLSSKVPDVAASPCGQGFKSGAWIRRTAAGFLTTMDPADRVLLFSSNARVDGQRTRALPCRESHASRFDSAAVVKSTAKSATKPTTRPSARA